MTLSKGFRLNSAPGPIDFRLAQQAGLARTVGGEPRTGILYAPTANGNVLATSGSALTVTLADKAVLAISRLGSTDGVDYLSSVGASILALNAPTANSWYATIYAKQNDGGTGGAGDADSQPVFGAVYGAAQASPAIPAVPTGATKIGHILIPTGAATSQATGVVLTETILHTAPIGAAIRFRSTTEMNGDVANLSDGALGYVRSGDVYFLKGGAWQNLSTLDDTGWIAASGVVGNYASAPTSYRRRRGIVYLKGQATPSANSQTMFTLPAGFRPASDFGLVMNRTGAVPGAIYANGAVVYVGPGGDGRIDWLSVVPFNADN